MSKGRDPEVHTTAAGKPNYTQRLSETIKVVASQYPQIKWLPGPQFM